VVEEVWRQADKEKNKKEKMNRPGLYANINKRKAKGISRPKSKSTITPKSYAAMKKGFKKKK
jgi:hypothetical protein|tara:strand:- start:158 stop:343 length:186 start_codon:yes stop_codon:yes gene_type:complete